MSISKRLIFNKVSVGSPGSETNIDMIVTESITMTEEALQVAVENNQNYNEGYTTTMSFRTLSAYAEDGATPVLDPDSTNSITYCGGVSLFKKKDLTFHGVNGSNTLKVEDVFVNGRRVYENGREEYEISCQFDSTKAEITSLAS